MRKTAGIIVDNYKIKTFETDLKEKGFDIISQTPNAPGLTLLKIQFEEEKLKEVTDLIKTIDLKCKASRN